MKKYLLFLIAIPLLLVSCGGNFQKYTSQDAIDAFNEAGLEVGPLEPVDLNGQNFLPKTFIEGQRFVLPSLGEDSGGRVFSFETEDDLKVVQDYYEALTGMFASWVYVKDNLLVQINIRLPKEQAEQYREALESLD